MRLDRRHVTSLPIALLAGYVLWAVNLLLTAVRIGIATAQLDRWDGFTDGLWFAALGLITVGWYELAGRATGRTRAILGVVTVCSALQLVGAGVSPVLELWLRAHPSQGGEDVLFGAGIATAIISVTSTVAIALAAGAWRKNRVMATLLIAAVIVRDGSMYVPATNAWLYAHPDVAQIAISAVTIVWAVIVLVLATELGVAHPAVDPSADLARRGLRRAATAMFASIAFAFAVGVVFLTSLHSFQAIRLALVGAPLIAMIAMLVFAWGMLDAARSRLAGLSSWFTVGSAAAVLWYASLLARQAFALSRLISRDRDFNVESERPYIAMITTWQVVGPVIGLTGLLLAIEAIARLARATEHHALRTAVRVRATAFLVLMAAAVVLELQLTKTRSDSEAMMYLLSSVACAICALIALAQTCRRGAEAIGTSTTLPVARVV